MACAVLTTVPMLGRVEAAVADERMRNDTYWVMVEEAADLARDAYRCGLRPSEIIRVLAPFFAARQWSVTSLLLVATATRAFRLSIPECTGAPGWGTAGSLVHHGAFDDYLVPLIERRRWQWDDPE